MYFKWLLSLKNPNLNTSLIPLTIGLYSLKHNTIQLIPLSCKMSYFFYLVLFNNQNATGLYQ